MKQRLPRDRKADQIDARRMLSAVVEAAPVALCVIGQDGCLELVQGQPFPALGLIPGEAEGRRAKDVWKSYDILNAALTRAIAGEPATATVVAGDTAVEFRLLPIAGTRGRAAHVFAVAVDVTARYAGMVQIPEREEYLQGILDTVVDGIVTIDELGLIRDFNPAAAEMFGYQPHEVVGKTVTILMPEPYRSDHDGHIRRYLETGRTHVIGRRRETVGLRKDGTIFPMEIAVSELKVGEHRHFTGIVRDITEQQEAERALRESEERYALAAKGANDGLWDWDLENGTIYYSPRWKSMLGYDDVEIGASPEEWTKRIHRDDVERFQQDLEAHLQGRTATLHSEYRIRRKSGEILHMVARGVAMRDVDGHPYRMAGSQSDVTERRRAEERLVHDALHDALTGLANRTLMNDRLGQALVRLKRNPAMGFALAMLNLDRFRVVNESLGHTVGDDLLLAVSRRLENQLQPGDTLARLGADSFALLMEDVDDEASARKRVEGIQRVVGQPYRLGGREVFSSVSVGIVAGDGEYLSANDILRNAELALSRAKKHGKGKAEIYHETLHREAVGIMETETDLRKAIEENRVVAYYQPIIELDTGRIVGFEALARIEHPDRGIIPPSEFIGIAEDTGLIVPLCEHVLAQACGQTARWCDEMKLDDGLAVSVNLSARNLADDGLFGKLEQVLADTGLAPGNLRVEITESLIMANPELMEQVLARLKTLELGLALDDFGTGYSSLSHLQRFPLDTLKIDRSFVARIDSETRDQELAGIIVMLAHTLGLDVVAEGVETAAHAGHLRELGCEYVQGFHYAAPLRAEDAGELLRSGLKA
jgi:PAS domain S-box-containing protein/diguanylate cyclase (GGDEF)-like protein